MNRLVLIGNGFDLAHGLKTSYKDFIFWYWKQRVTGLYNVGSNTSDDSLCTLEVIRETWSAFCFRNMMSINKEDGKSLFQFLNTHKEHFMIRHTAFFGNIHKSIETKGWVDIENEYYKLLEQHSIINYSTKEIEKLNKQLQYLQELLTKYLTEINQQDISVDMIIKDKIYSPIETSDISIEGKSTWNKYINACAIKDKDFWDRRLRDYGIIGQNRESFINDIDNFNHLTEFFPDIPRPYRLPESIMLLDFNYTKTVNKYMKTEDIFNNNDCLTNIKTIKYLESDKYRKVLQFIESAPFQVCIMGHSCGNSDRTLLNTIFEHKNCVSIKPYYYLKEDGTDNYIELIQNISRNFKDMKLMRDRVVNKEYCEPLIGEKPGVVEMD